VKSVCRGQELFREAGESNRDLGLVRGYSQRHTSRGAHLQTPADGVRDVGKRFLFSLPAADATGDGGALDNVRAVLIPINRDLKLHRPILLRPIQSLRKGESATTLKQLSVIFLAMDAR
jgi:hypothetical protein